MELSVWRGIWLPEDILSVSVCPGSQAAHCQDRIISGIPARNQWQDFPLSTAELHVECTMIRRKQDNLADLEGRAVMQGGYNQKANPF